MKLGLVLLLGALAVCAIAQPEPEEQSHVLQKRRFRLRRALDTGWRADKYRRRRPNQKRDTEDVQRSKRRFRLRRALHKVEKAVRPVGKPILQGAAGAAITKGVVAVGLGKRDTEEVQRSKRRFRLRRALHKVEKAVRPVGKPILQGAAGAAITKGVVAVGLGKRNTEEVQRSKRRFRLRRALHKVEKAVRPVGKPILQGAAGAAITKGVIAAGLGKRDAEEVQRSKRRWRIRRTLHKIEHNLRPVGKPILEGAGMAAGAAAVAAAGKKRDVEEVQRSKRRFRLRRVVNRVVVPPRLPGGIGKRNTDTDTEVQRSKRRHFRLRRALDTGWRADKYRRRRPNQKRDTEEVQRSKRRFRLRRALHKVEKAVRPVGKPILQGAAGAAITKGVIAAGLGKRDVERSERSNPFTEILNSLKTTTVDKESAGRTIVDSAIGYPF